MKIKVEKGFINPREGENIIVELENGFITGAVYQPVNGVALHNQGCFVDADLLPFYGVVEAWYPSAVSKLKEGELC